MRNMDGGVIVTGFDVDNSIFTTWFVFLILNFLKFYLNYI